MAYSPPGVQVFQVTTQQSAPASVGVARTVAVIADFPIGPLIGRITPAQTITNYGDPNAAGTSGFKGPGMLAAGAGMAALGRAFDLSIVVGRAGCVYASAQANDASSGHPFSVVGVGGYAGARGKRLSVAITSGQIQVQEIQHGGFGANEIYRLTFYQLAGSPVGTATLSFNGTAAGAGFAASSIIGGSPAAALQTYLNGITSIGASGVTVTQLTAPMTGAYAFKVEFTGTALKGLPQPAIAVSANTLASGTGSIAPQSIVVTDTTTSAVVFSLYAAQASAGWLTNGDIAAAVNAMQNPSLNTSAINLTAVSNTAGLPVTQTLPLTGGSDGVGVTVGTDVVSPDGSTNTIPYILNQIASGAYGNVDWVVTAFDAAAVSTMFNTAVAAGLGNGVYLKLVAAPDPGTSVATLLGAYQNANNQRTVFVGHGSLTGGTGTVPGRNVAAMVAFAKAYQSPEQNLPFAQLPGLANVQPIDPATALPLDVPTLNNLAGAGFTVFSVIPRMGGLVLRDLLTTAPQTDQFGQPNRFLRPAAQDVFDTLALQLQAALSGVILQASSGPAQVIALLNTIGTNVMQSSKNVYTNGYIVNSTFDPQQLAGVVNIQYGDRPPIVSVTVNLTPVAGLSN